MIKALFEATATEVSRPVLQNVFWDVKKELLAATDGHILRIEPLDFPLSESVQFLRTDFKASVKHAPEEVSYIDNITGSYPNFPGPYPDYLRVLPQNHDLQEFKALQLQAVDFSLLNRFYKSFVAKPSYLIMGFTGQTSGICVYSKTQFVGMIMPMRISHELPKLSPL